MIHLDTHVVAWLYAGELDRLSAHALEALERERLAISPVVVLELTLLCEIGRITVPPERIVAELDQRVGLRMSTTSFGEVVASATGCAWTRDPFDRLIVGNAIAEGVPLLTKDATIRAHMTTAQW